MPRVASLPGASEGFGVWLRSLPDKSTLMLIDPSSLSRAEVQGLVNGLVYPRPIAWVSTISGAGVRNLAPFSFFNGFAFHPIPMLGIGPGSRNGVNKDSLANIKETDEFVVNLVSWGLAEKANLSSADVAADVEEWSFAGVTPLPSDDVAPERVAEAPASLECRVFQIVDLGPEDAPTSFNSLVIGRVTRIHVNDGCPRWLDPSSGRTRSGGALGREALVQDPRSL